MMNIFTKSKFHKQAKVDYRSSRGYYQRSIVNDGLKKLTEINNEVTKQMEILQNSFNQINKDEYEALVSAYARILVINRLTEIHGIAENKAFLIYSKCFRSKLEDLSIASTVVTGIGPNLQRSINEWIIYHRNLLPKYVQQNFLGKDKIMKEFAEQRFVVVKQLRERQKLLSTIVELRSTAQEKYDEFQSISEKTFYEVLANKLPPETIDSFISGYFAVWEPIPKWFASLLEILKEEHDNGGKGV